MLVPTTNLHASLQLPRLLRVIGSHGTGAGELQTPMGLRFSPDMEEVIVADSANSRICKYVPPALARAVSLHLQ
jgi:hypothetical protein